MPTLKFLISCNLLSPSELVGVLNEGQDRLQECQLELKHRSPSRASGLDPALVVAIISASSAAVSGLITGLFRILEGRYNRTAKIVIRGADGTTVEVPVGTSPEQLERLAEVAKSLVKPEMRVILS